MIVPINQNKRDWDKYYGWIALQREKKKKHSVVIFSSPTTFNDIIDKKLEEPTFTSQIMCLFSILWNSACVASSSWAVFAVEGSATKCLLTHRGSKSKQTWLRIRRLAEERAQPGRRGEIWISAQVQGQNGLEKRRRGGNADRRVIYWRQRGETSQTTDQQTNKQRLSRAIKLTGTGRLRP